MIYFTGKESLREIHETASFNTEVGLTTTALCQILENFTSGRLRGEELEAIAEVLERESVVYEHGKEKLMASILFELSSPEVNGPINAIRCLELIATLSK